MMLVKLSAVLAPLLAVFYFLDSHLPRFYVFSPEKLQELSQAAVAAHPDNATALIYALADSLEREYGSRLISKIHPDEWFFNNAGGAMGSMIILHASITEYLIIFGTPLQTEGHTGVHLADDYFTILAGEQKTFAPGEIEARVFRPGDQNHMARGVGQQYYLHGWALELAQGWIPSMLPFGYLDTFTSTLDFANLWKTTWLTGRNMVAQLLMGKF